MGFDYEYQMCSSAQAWMISQDLIVKKEFPTPWGICDLVGCSLNKNNVKHRLAIGQKKSIGSELKTLIHSVIPDQELNTSVSFDDLYKTFADVYDKSQIQKEIEVLIKNKFIVIAPDGAYQKINGWQPLHKRLISVELKLSKISEAFKQAINNLEFADESYVGLPFNVAKKVYYSRRKLDFQRAGIGILAVDENKCSVILKAERAKNHSFSYLQTYFVEKFWSSLLETTKHKLLS